MKRFSEKIADLLSREGLSGAALSFEEDFPGFGDSRVVFNTEPLLLCFERERGREFLALGSVDTPDKIHDFNDVAVAMGWRQISDVIERSEPEPLSQILGIVHAEWDSLVEFFRAGRVGSANLSIEKIAAERGRRMMNQLDQNRLR